MWVVGQEMYSSGERIGMPNRCGMGARSGRRQVYEQAEKFFLGSGGLIRLDARYVPRSIERIQRHDRGKVKIAALMYRIKTYELTTIEDSVLDKVKFIGQRDSTGEWQKPIQWISLGEPYSLGEALEYVWAPLKNGWEKRKAGPSGEIMGDMDLDQFEAIVTEAFLRVVGWVR